MSTAVLGSGTFQDLYIPVKGKSEWGMDTLTRRMSGARSLLEAFVATLAQGDFYQGYYLQTWEADDRPEVATIQLNYKGLLTGGTPLPDIQSAIILTKGSTDADFSDENDDNGRIYDHIILWRYSYSAPETFLTDESVGTRPVYAKSAKMDFVYNTAETTYRYIAVGRPVEPRYDEIGFEFTPVIVDRRITTDDGRRQHRLRESFFELTPVEIERVVAFESRNVIGSPYWECTDVVRLELGNEPEP